MIGNVIIGAVCVLAVVAGGFAWWMENGRSNEDEATKEQEGDNKEEKNDANLE